MRPLERIRYLSDAEIERIHDLSIRLCWEMGLKTGNSELRERARAGGAHVDAEVVKFPPDLVQWAIERAPKALTLMGRTGQRMETGGVRTEQYPCNHTNSVKTLEFGARTLRDSTLRDLERSLTVCDALEHVWRVGATCYPWDVPARLREVRTVEAVLTHTAKNLTGAPQTVAELELWCEALELVVEAPLAERYVFSVVISPRSPMALAAESAEMVLACTARRLPVIVAPCPMAGGTSPYTVAGTVLQQNAESLCMIALVQMLAEGCPIIYGGAAGPLDLRTGSLSYGAQERNLALGATMDLGRWYGFPRYSPAGSVDSPWVDVQIGIEKMAAMLTRVLSAGQLTPSFGAVYNGLAISLEQMVIDHEIYACCRRLLEGFEVTDTTAGLAAIMRVGHGGEFLADDHTLAWMRERSENLLPELANRGGDAGWPMLEAAHAKVEALVGDHATSVPTERVERVRAWAAAKAAKLSP